MIDSDVLMSGWMARLVAMTTTDDAVVTTLEAVWAATRATNPGVPQVVFEIGPGRESTCSSIGWDQRYPVIQVNLMRGDRKTTSAELLERLLHWASHALVYEPGKVASSEGRYHGKGYKAAAEQLGLGVEASDPIGGAAEGWSVTKLARGTLSRYRPEVDRVSRALGRWEPTSQPKTQEPRQSRAQVMVQCSCAPPRKIRAAQKSINKGGIRCEVCGERFVPAAALGPS